MKIARVALDLPIDEAFDFGVPEGAEPAVGSLVVVPFGRQRKVGVVVGRAARSSVPAERLKAIERVVDDVPPLSARDLDLFGFCASYYQRPLGEVIAASLPPRLRQANRRPIALPGSRRHRMRATGLADPHRRQERALEACRAVPDHFHPVLLHGVTGSGKTEVYLRLIAETLERGRQALFLVPEIGLTPQLELQVRGRFPGAQVASAHSHVGAGERAQAWLAAQSGAARVVMGTRLAVLTPFRDLGLVIVDEEHDPSYKQQEGLRYSARDVAVRRGTAPRHPGGAGLGHPFARELCQRARRPLHARRARPSARSRAPRCPRCAPSTPAPTAPRKGSPRRWCGPCASAWRAASNRWCS